MSSFDLEIRRNGFPDSRNRKRLVSGSGQETGAANASIKPVQVSIEGLARHAVSLHAQQAGSVNFVMTTCCSDFAVVSVIEYCSKTRELLPFVCTFDNKNGFFANAG